MIDRYLLCEIMDNDWLSERVSIHLLITCEFPSAYGATPNHVCKEDEDHICRDISASTAAGKHSLSDHSQAGVFKVDIRNLSLSDAGVYWCGAETSAGDIRYISLFTKVQIKIRCK
uniref:Immunoglobulin V-set domain-containing protein n=1 Tax=Electrophorus electricus TaxID=8005 RepID=A0AAY5EX17_ELEEL